jgi:threonylcarbamoyladenosine tRNA methylthiotransferase MtaB
LTKNRFLTAHIFPYSPREGTPAAAMPDQVSQEDKKRRAADLAALQEQITREILTAEIEKAPVRRVLFETFSNGKATGHTDSFIEIIAPSDVDIKGKEFYVRLLRVEKSTIIGEIIKK